MTIDIKPDPSTPSASPAMDMPEDDITPDHKPDLPAAPITPTKAGKAQKPKHKRKSPANATDGNDDDTATPSPKKIRSPKKGKAAAKPDDDDNSARGVSGVSAWEESGWTADKREAFIARLLGDGIKQNTVDSLAQEFNLTSLQVKWATQGGSAKNLRNKVAKAARGET